MPKSSNQPFYHLRPNKFIDRELFVLYLNAIDKLFDIPNYSYLGFGSYYFDDFKILHNKLGINKMVSLEAEAATYERAKFNKPLSCIEILNSTSTDYIAEFNPDASEKHMFWLDYTAPKQLGTQINDFCSLIEKLNPGDIVRITLNANLTSLGFENETDQRAKQELRLNELHKRVGSFLPTQCNPDDLTTANYPSILLSCLRNAAIETLPESRFRNEFLMPLFSTYYQDGQAMFTFTGMVLDDHGTQDDIRALLYGLPFCSCDWESINQICIPPLTYNEITSINKKLPVKDEQLDETREEFKFIFKNDETFKNYLSFYKHYPNFHHVNF